MPFTICGALDDQSTSENSEAMTILEGARKLKI